MNFRIEVGADPVHSFRVNARGASPSPSLLPVIAAGLAVAAGFVALVMASRSYVWAHPAGDEPYNLVVEGFRSGHVWLAKDAPEALAHAANPYDFATYRPYLAAPWGLVDMSYYRGHLYAYFGVTPAVILFWPYRIITGGWLHQAFGVLVFSLIGYAFIVGMAVALRRRYFPATNPLLEPAMAVLLGSVTTLPVFLVRPGLYEVSISCGFALTMMALAALWNAWHRPTGKCAWIAAASAAYGLAVGSRPSLLFGAAILFLPAAAALWDRIRGRGPARWLGYFLAALIPISAVGAALAAFNDARFGNPLQFGHDYQLSGNDVYGTKSFAPRFFWENFRIYFLDPPRWHAGFPFVWEPPSPTLHPGHLPIEFFFGTLAAFPVLLLVLLVPIACRGSRVLAGFSMVALVMFLAAAIPICCYTGATSRYLLDFIPALALLSVLGLLGLGQRPSSAASSPSFALAVRGAAGAALVYSVAVAWLLAVALGSFYRGAERGVAMLASGRLDEAITHYDRLCRINPDFRGRAELAIGTALLGQGRRQDGMAYLISATRDQPSLATAYFNLGGAYLDEGRFAESADSFRRAAGLDPYDGEAEAQLGVALFRLGRTQEAIDHEKAALRIEPTLEEARRDLEVLERAIGNPTPR
jgi:hypothetical protein